MISRSLSSLANFRLQIKWLIVIVGLAVLAPASWFIYTLYQRSAEAETQNVQLLGALDSSYEAMSVIGELSLAIDQASAQGSLVPERELSQIRYERSLVDRLLVVVPKIRDYQPFEDDTESLAVLDTLEVQIQNLNESYLNGVKSEVASGILQSARLTLDQYRLILRELDTQQLDLRKSEIRRTLTVFLPLTIGFMVLGGVVALGLYRNLSSVLEKEYDLSASLSERDRWFQALFDRSPVAVGVARDGISLHVNDAYLRLFGLTERDKVIGSSIFDQFAPESQEDVREGIANFPPDKDEYENIEIVAVKPDGTTFQLMATIGRITLPDGPAFIGFFTDITEQKLAQLALTTSEHRLALMFRSTSDMLILYKIEPSGSLTIDIVNQAYKDNISKWLPSANMDIVGRDRDEVLHEWGFSQDEIEKENEKYDQAIAGLVPIRTEVIAKTPTGDLTFEASVEPITDTNGKCTHVLWNGRDITKSKQESRDLEESQKRLELVFQSTSDLVVLYKVLPDGTIIFDAMNEPFKKTTLLNRPGVDLDVIGKERSSVLKSWGFDEARVDKELLLYERIAKEHFVHRDEVDYVIDDREIILESSVAPVLDPVGNCTHILWSARDITERTRAEKALRESEERYALIEQAVNDGVWDWNIVTGDDYLSPRWKEILGYEEHELANREETFRELVHPDDRDQVSEAINKHFEKNEQYRVEIRMLHKDGNYRWILTRGEAIRNEDGEPVRMVGSITDVTERISTNKALKESEERLALMFRSTSDMLLLLKVMPDGAFVFDSFNKAYQDYIQTIFPNADMDIIGLERSKGLESRDIPKDATEIELQLYRRAVEEKVPQRTELEAQIGDNEVVLEVHIQPIINADGKVTHLLWNGRDMAESKRREAELKNLNESLEQRVKERTQEIQKSEARFRSLSEASPAGIQFVSQDGVTEFANDAWNEILGIDWRDKPELGWTVVQHPDDKQRIYDGWMDFINSDRKFRQSEARIIHPKKGVRWISAYVSKTKQADGLGGYAVVLVDITEERTASEKLARSEERFRAISEASPFSILITDLDGGVTYVNAAYEDLMQATFEETKGWGWAKFIHPEDVDALTKEWKEYLSGSDRFENEHRVVRSNGDVAWLYCVAAPLMNKAGHVVMLEDITERVEAQLALQDSEERFRSMTEASPAGITITRPDGEILYFNDAYTEMMGLELDPAEDVAGPPPFHPDDAVEIQSSWKEFVDGGFDRYYNEARLLTTDGGLKWVKHHAAPMRVAGEIVAYVSVFVDNTEIRIAQFDLVVAKETAEKANSAKDEFLSRVSHEFRTPLNAILGFAQVMGMDEQDENNTESIRQIIDAGQHLLSLVDEVLDIAQIESGDLHLDLQTVDVLKHLEECTRLLSPLTDEKDISISIENNVATQFNITADPKRLNQVLINVLSNAIKYNRQAGKVGISVSEITERKTVIEITDTGAGIHPDKLARVFAPFDRLGAESTDVSGTGIGLSLSSSLMEAMGGSIDIESEISKGTTVTIVLPTSGSASPESAVADKSVKILDVAEVEKKLKVHLVEDNASNYKLMQTIFSKRGSCELILSENAADALDQAKQDPPDLFLLDVNLPDSTGTELLIKIRAVPRLQNVPVIVVSADANRSMIDAFEQMGVLAYMTKPVDIALLLSTIESVELGNKEVR